MSDSDNAPSVFDHHHDLGDERDLEQYSAPTQPTSRDISTDEGVGSYDLKPPPPATPLSNTELLADRLFSLDHLKVIIHDAALHTRFSSFLNKYRPASAQTLMRYLDTQKILSAVEYANAIAEKLAPGSIAAILEDDFEARSRDAVNDLVTDALPGYVTHRLVQLVTETLVKEITGQNTPIMRELVPSLAEVYCLTDPALPDNPIVYASEEFYRTSQYGREYVIGRNCRFLQGPRSSGATVTRLIEALAEGQEICETILNYRRDGSPFMNLLMIAPLYDNKGTVRYFIGAQIDVSGLIERGRGLESFERLLAQDRREARYGDNMPAKSPNIALAELSSVLDDSEIEIVQNGRREKRPMGSGTSTPVGPAATRPNAQRRYIGMDDPDDRNLWPAPHLGPSGRLPGVFQNYLLVRPAPSLRITFTSPALRIPGLLQARFLDRIGGPAHVREGILNALSSGVGVTAKITWLPHSNTNGSSSQRASSPAPFTVGSRASNSRAGAGSATGSTTQQQLYHGDGKQRWIHCTPLLGSDEKVGVWMVVMVESENITGAINVSQYQQQAPLPSNHPSNRSLPERGHESVTSSKYGAGGSGRLYQEYLRREGRADSMIGNAGQGKAVQPSVSSRSRGPSMDDSALHGRVTGQEIRSGQYMGSGTSTSGQYAAREARVRTGEEGFADF